MHGSSDCHVVASSRRFAWNDNTKPDGGIAVPESGFLHLRNSLNPVCPSSDAAVQFFGEVLPAHQERRTVFGKRRGIRQS